MLQLYFYPMACSLASRIALMEAGISARYHAVDIFKKKTMEDDGDFWATAPKGAVPVLQYIADLRPELGLAPPAGHPDRYRLQEWLSFVGCEIHKAFLFPTFWYANEAAKASARERIGQNVSIAAAHLQSRQYLVGDHFTVADAYLAWALLLLGRGGVNVAQWPALVACRERMRARPQVCEAIAIEQQLGKAIAR